MGRSWPLASLCTASTASTWLISALSHRCCGRCLPAAALWDAARAAIESTGSPLAGTYDSIACTRCFSGSPHVDSYDVDRQCATSLGDFTGGNLCIEADASTVLELPTRGRVVVVDGRFPHWVTPSVGGECSKRAFHRSGSLERLRLDFETIVFDVCHT